MDMARADDLKVVPNEGGFGVEITGLDL